ncbi:MULTISPECIES: 50S ribosomal protein L6 [Bacillales]|jgi:large subunit ribosomal protein L6|uniref:Large ribosomal subunit protein uL6 n=1 Tax=Brevibacillus aydinogluensis TaxID=927786 RepID=A0AA48MAW5_9BACL|nr:MULTISPECIES: 50S ribosomal protein L6 [Bacillales]REK67640.1 MAG: 50S ribosomal protein L6 [Brevibacillus sp.]MBR8661346.1 50S ribosomal protein L6 [Brevibacillus sp. NL20B1]MDT3417599.1 large subunit ribosomal protein L6 [Brevibacillus aydinogluensis]NNV04168.1 50S ribosomal protein L6 [Brevibacillus sp. MCWH]UFJ62421.1 50S ribosomal protein L6 [Anoxybacillus sediminis]
MSRVGKKPIVVPAGVTLTLNGSELTVKGPKGTLVRKFHPDMKININDNEVIVERPSDNKLHRSLHGTTRALIANMVTGVSEGFSRTLELVGVGYRAAKSGKGVTLSLGFSHPVEITPEEGIEIEVPNQTTLVVKGIDKERVGQVAAEIRSIRKPEPYKGKGIKYSDEVVRRKEGKKGK